MHADVTTHPTADELAAYSLGKLNDAATLAVAEHLETCLDCRRTAADVPPDTFVGILQAARAVLPTAAPTLGEMSSWLGAAPSLLSGVGPQADADLVLPPELADHPRFRILRVLGRGGMGVVYLAEHRLMKQMRAVKVINQSLLNHPEALPRFHREVRTAAQLDHRNIVRAYDAEQAGNLHLLVMEYVEGFDLAKVLERKGPLPIPHSCHYARQAALGLQHAFERGMVHRDIKPQNLLLVPQKGLVKVTDFGLARLASERQRGKGLTQQDAVMGTPEYMAPEQATDARTADIRADVYSLGCTLYTLLAGRTPFQEETPMRMILAHLEREAPPLHQLRPDVPPELSAAVAKMMAKDPGQRYQTPKEVAEVLAQFCKTGAKTVPAASPVAPPAALSAGTLCAADTSSVPTAQVETATPVSAQRKGSYVPPAAPSAPPWEERTTAPAPQPEKEPQKRHAPSSSGGGTRHVWRLAVAGAAAIVLAAGIVLSLKTPDGLLVLEIDQADAEVSVDDGKIVVRSKGEREPLEIKVKPGEHNLEVRKGDFVAYSNRVMVRSGKNASISVSLSKPPEHAIGEKPAPLPIVITAKKEVGFNLGRVEKGDVLMLQYVSGKWKAWGTKATESPDAPQQERGEQCRLVIATPSVGKEKGRVLAVVPPGTATSPFRWVAPADFDRLILRINGNNKNFAGNPDGRVTYKVQLQKKGPE
jgi:serine/threonine protein kinase